MHAQHMPGFPVQQFISYNMGVPQYPLQMVQGPVPQLQCSKGHRSNDRLSRHQSNDRLSLMEGSQAEILGRPCRLCPMDRYQSNDRLSLGGGATGRDEPGKAAVVTSVDLAVCRSTVYSTASTVHVGNAGLSGTNDTCRLPEPNVQPLWSSTTSTVPPTKVRPKPSPTQNRQSAELLTGGGGTQQHA